MRKSFDGLCGLVTNRLGQNPSTGDVYLFLNKPRNRVKLLGWEPGGFILFYKWLENGTFELPNKENKGKSISIDYGELAMIISVYQLPSAGLRSITSTESLTRPDTPTRFTIITVPGESGLPFIQ